MTLIAKQNGAARWLCCASCALSSLASFAKQPVAPACTPALGTDEGVFVTSTFPHALYTHIRTQTYPVTYPACPHSTHLYSGRRPATRSLRPKTSFPNTSTHVDTHPSTDLRYLVTTPTHSPDAPCTPSDLHACDRHASVASVSVSKAVESTA